MNSDALLKEARFLGLPSYDVLFNPDFKTDTMHEILSKEASLKK